MKILKILLVISIILNFIAFSILYSKNKKEIILDSIGESRVGRYEHLIRASGTLYPLNYENESIYVVDIRCNLKNKTCNFASVSGGTEGNFYFDHDIHDIASYDGTRVIIENNGPNCRREIWKIDLLSEAIYLDSHPKELKDQFGDCSFLERKTLSSKFVSFLERRKQLNKL